MLQTMRMALASWHAGNRGDRLEHAKELCSVNRPPFWLVKRKSEPSSSRLRNHIEELPFRPATAVRGACTKAVLIEAIP